MEISKYMKRNVVSIPQTSTIREAAAVLVKHHIGFLPIVDKNKKLVGVVGLRDLLALELPDFVSFIADVDYVHDFGAVETTRPPARTLNKSIKTLMKPAISVHEDTGLLRVYALMLQHELHDMPVVSKDEELVGVASRVDIGAAILSAWAKVE
ncbi:MAG TPA: CBS domain-containing protein [Anaerolineales bacterium]|nr:CBS domain-containing protein [Anaerolineales bacterium]